ncbi:MAG: hypothetical protein WD025_06355 [Bacteriovoracaceae bacterium]
MKLIVFIFLFSLAAFGELEFEDAAFPEIMPSGRALAMGNAYMSKVDDGWAAFYNPAGLGTVRGVQFHLTNLYLETNNGYLDITGGSGSFFESTSNYTKAFDADDLRTLMAESPGHLSHARIGLFPNITFRGLTLGYVYSQQNRGRLVSETADFELAERVDSGPVLAMNVSLFGGILKFGVSGILLTRKQIIKDFEHTEPTTIDKEVDYKKGTMTYLTAGTRLTLPFYLLPTFSLVYRNSSQAKWYAPEMGGAPPDIPQTLDAGFSLTPFTARNARLHLEFNLRDVGNQYDTVGSNRKAQFGMEFDWARTFFVRLGTGDGWGSGGVGVRNDKFIFDLSTYAIEASSDPNAFREEEDRRYVLSVASGF